MPNNRAVDFIQACHRREQVLSPKQGPGTYTLNNSFAKKSKGKTIGVRREEKLAYGPGPGHYSPEKQVHKVQPKS